jgi:hypothetical protein
VKSVFETSDRTVAQLLRGALEAEGMPAIVQGEHLSSLQGETPVGASAEYRVAIIDDEQLPRASLFVKSWAGEAEATGDAAPWTCARCGESHEPQFRSCWRCGAEGG